MSRFGYKVVLPFGILAVMLVVMAYAPAISGPWLLDDPPNLLDNRALQQFKVTQFDDFRDVAVSGRAGPFGRPVSISTFIWQRDQGGLLDSGSAKTFNLVLHLLIGVLVAYLALQILLVWGIHQRSAVIAAVTVAALWCSAPLHVSTVMYAVQRMSQLSTLCVLAGLAIYVRFRVHWLCSKPQLQHLGQMLLWLALCFYFGIYSKENALLLGPLLLVVEAFVFGGVVAGARVPLVDRFTRWLLALYLCIPVLLYLLAPTWLTDSYAQRDFSLQDRFSVQLPLLWKYLQWTLVPDLRPLVFLQDGQWSLSENSLLFWFAGAAWIAAMAAVLALRSRPLIFGLCFFLVGHSLESSVFALEVAYEHRNYLPSVGVFIAVVGALFQLGHRYQRSGAVAVFLCTLFTVSILMLYLRAQIWGSAEGIYQYANRHAPESARADYLYAAALLDTSDIVASGEDGSLLRQARLLEARRRLGLLATAQKPDIAAIVLLIRFDSSVIANFEARQVWESMLIDALSARSLQAEDYAALAHLVDCLSTGNCEMSDRARHAFEQKLDTITVRPMIVANLKAQLTIDNGDSEFGGARFYRELAERRQQNPEVYARLIEIYSESGERGKALVAIQSLLHNDPGRRFLAPVVQSLE